MQELIQLAPWAGLTLVLWLAAWAVRRWFPAGWAWMQRWPTSKESLSHIVQALPTTMIGAVVGALASGDDLQGAVYGALFGALAPVWHHLVKAAPGPYRGALRDAGGRADDHLRKTMGLLVVAIFASGCTVPLERARTAGIEARQAGSAATVESSSLDDRCRKLDNQRTTWGAIAKGSGALAGGAGLATIPIEGNEATVALASAAAGLAAAAVVAVYVEESKGAAWARECAER